MRFDAGVAADEGIKRGHGHAHAMANRLAVLAVAVVVGLALYAGLVFVDDQLRGGPAVAPDGEVVVGNGTLHLDRVGRPTVVGEVRNGLARPIGDVLVTVTFRRGGEVVGTATGTTLAPTVARQHAAPFVVRLENRSAEADGFSVTVEHEAGADRPYARYAVEDRLADESQDQVIVTGTVTNEGGRAAPTHVVATFYDAEGRVIGARSVRTAPDVLQPGETGEFTVRFRTLGNLPSRAGDVASYDLSVYGEPTSSG